MVVAPHPIIVPHTTPVVAPHETPVYYRAPIYVPHSQPVLADPQQPEAPDAPAYVMSDTERSTCWGVALAALLLIVVIAVWIYIKEQEH